MIQTPFVVIEREYSVPVERVFTAWTDPSKLLHWFRSSDNVWVHSADVDLRAGGAYRFEIHGPDNEVVIVAGTYLRVDPPHRLEFTAKWAKSSTTRPETVVMVELTATSGGTKLTLTHSQFSSDRSAEAHNMGWTGVLTTLGNFVSQENA